MAKAKPKDAKPGSPEADPAEDDSWDVRGDGQLRFLVAVVNGTTNEFPITLTVGGVLVSGFLASGHRYFDEFADQMTSGIQDTPGLDREELRAQFALPGQVFLIDEEEGKRPPPRYIHVLDARYYFGREIVTPTVKGGRVWWRGRIESVDGRQFGAFHEREE
jgi:hypothetical protein